MSTAVERKTVVVQGLGFVGSAMAVATASAQSAAGQPLYNVVGVDLPTAEGTRRVNSLTNGKFPFGTSDTALEEATKLASSAGNLTASVDLAAYATADIVIVDVHLDVDQSDANKASVDFSGFENAIRTVAERMKENALVIVETTVPPGTCQTVARPLIQASLKDRGIPEDRFLLAHSYERVMPGEHYLDSIRNYWRVYAGATNASAEACRTFLETVVNVRDFPLTRLGSTTASELAKVMENSYRAVNIAFIEEWARLSERIEVDLFEVVRAIRMRPTHNNIRQPGFGVGGYCLTKDPLLAEVSARQIFGMDDLQFPFSKAAIEVNRLMPLETLEQVDQRLGGLEGRKILLLGATYRQDVSDTRYSPSELFVKEAARRGASVSVHDPYVAHWPELDMAVLNDLPDASGYDAVVFAVPHKAYRELDLSSWLNGARPFVFDANDVISDSMRLSLQEIGVPQGSVGRG